MELKHYIEMLFLVVLLSFGTVQQALSNDYSEEIKIADRKVILAQYEEAKEIYQNIISSADFSVVEAYAYYKLGSLYKKQNEPLKAKEEYEKGLLSLKKCGKTNHQIGKYLARALL
ncbi:MAG: hypothetical protein COB49_06135 [Alphaproteobacteria bacterium]|nr:MAG: hypothetical protein COB49_06135 [Alphaproteobacteria bacterium]